VFTVEERDAVRERLLALARDDAAVVAAAITGSHVIGGGDEWSDIDLSFGIAGELDPVMERWATTLRQEFGAIHHWDLPWGPTIYRVFLLPEWLQVDIAFTPADEFGPRGPNWQTVFGDTAEVGSTPPAPLDETIGLAWLYARHAHTCIQRDKPWQAEWSISGMRDQVLALACRRLGYATRYAKGADLLPAEITKPLEFALVASLDAQELRRALVAGAAALADELDRTDAALGARLRPLLVELA
jgi:hypothetical protein